ncbi:lipase maturation factor [Plakobranchus ocellatus]|uniref:Lipase maturation factor n=1 Tax=Plakobranchus ocellatus TaxID=259542 RepID=A0AAV3ZAP0_9GAST|nr:lipase maturation factor [Plakobranchus ocellatus]
MNQAPEVRNRSSRTRLSVKNKEITEAEPTSPDEQGHGKDNKPGDGNKQESLLNNVPEVEVKEKESVKEKSTEASVDDLEGSFWLTRIVMVRYMGFMYFVAFLVSLHQNKQLVGKKGLLPADVYLNTVMRGIGRSNSWSLLSAAPTVFWFVNFEKDLDFWLDVVAWLGLAIAAFLMLSGAGNWPLLTLEWILYHSLVNIGQTWFSFGWESQMIETGFLTIFLCPMLSLSKLPKATPTSKINIFTYRWLIFRIMLGAGLIKARGDKCWQNLTCMNYHYETQPVPNPVSYFLHQSPQAMHKFEVLSNHFIELVAPFLLLLPHRRLCMIGGALQIFFQVVLIISGNLSFLNWLTILPSLACFDDASLAWIFSTSASSSLKAKAAALNRESRSTERSSLSGTIRKIFNITFGLLIAYLSYPVIMNLVSTRQVMNTSFSPLRLVNTYGAFGSITKKRTEVVFKGTNSAQPESPMAVWEEYEFKCKPGDINRRPCLISPYHYRLDWLMWFAAFQSYQNNPWLVHLAAKFLVNDEGAESLIAHNPFHGRPPPKYVRADHYRYIYSKLWSTEARNGQWWKRKYIGQYLPPVSLDMLRGAITNMGWPMPDVSY